MLVIAHRGASADAPENTMRAFELAVEQGADMIETDLHLTRDGVVALWHDSEIQGLPIERLSLEELLRLAPEVPTLEAVLAAFGSKIAFNLELKSGSSGDYAGLEARTLEVVRNLAPLDQMLFSAFSWPVLERMRALELRARLGVLRSSRFVTGAKAEAKALELGAEAVHPSVTRLDRAQVERMHSKGLRVNVYTVDDPQKQAQLLDWGVDGIFTNRPAGLIARLAAAGSAR